MLASPPPHVPPGTIDRQDNILQTRGSLRGCTVRLESRAVSRLKLVANPEVVGQFGPMSSCKLVAAALIMCAEAAAAAPSGFMAPSGKWTVDYAPHHCTASRSFGSGPDTLYLVVKPSPTSEVMQIALIKDGHSALATKLDAMLTFGEAAPIKVEQLNYGTDTKSVRMINLAPDQVAALSQTSRIIWDSSGAAKRLDVGPMAPVLKALAKCRADLADYWNITPERKATLKSPPTHAKPLLSLFSSDDYPTDAVRNDKSGMAAVVLLIDEQGKVRDCTLEATSGIAVIDAQTCVILKNRAKFSPAVDTNGKPTRGAYFQKIRWEMEN